MAGSIACVLTAEAEITLDAKQAVISKKNKARLPVEVKNKIMKLGYFLELLQ